jgi:hypothetical protein
MSALLLLTFLSASPSWADDSAPVPETKAPPPASGVQGETDSPQVTGFQIRWQTISAGGGAAVGASYAIRGSIGQHSASADHPAAGASYSHTGGFWPILRARAEAVIDRLFQDRFE